MNEVRFVDTTLRDGHQSLWAEAMTTGMILPIASNVDQAGFQAIEIVSPSFYKKCVRELREDPWERIRLVAKRIVKTPLRAIRNRQMAGFHITPPAIADLWLERLAANGVKEIRTSDPSNTPSGWREMIKAADRAGLQTILNLIFSISPKHTNEYYARIAREAAALKVFRICLKDPGGLLTPERTRELAPIVLRNSNGIPVELHTHCNTGLGPLCCLEAIQAGIKIVNTAIPPLANASSNPSLFSVAANARAMGYATDIDEQSLEAVACHFKSIAEREGFPAGAPVEYDSYHFIHQVPGGMISNFRHQLSKLGMEERLGEVLEEAGRVRAEFGYPIMVTPYSQFVGVQAAMNVILNARYKEVTDEVIQYALGLWGEEESGSMDPNVRDKILGRPRAAELARWEPPDTSIKELRAKLGGSSDDDLLLRYFAGAADVELMRASGRPKEYLSARHSLLTLIGELSRRRNLNRIFLKKENFLLRLEKGS